MANPSLHVWTLATCCIPGVTACGLWYPMLGSGNLPNGVYSADYQAGNEIFYQDVGSPAIGEFTKVPGKCIEYIGKVPLSTYPVWNVHTIAWNWFNTWASTVGPHNNCDCFDNQATTNGDEERVEDIREQTDLLENISYPIDITKTDISDPIQSPPGECEGCQGDKNRGISITIKTPIIVDNTSYIPANGGYIEISVTGLPGNTFSLDLEDADECSILSSPIEDLTLPQTGIYTFTQKFPAHKSGKELYTFKNKEIVLESFYQYPNPTITFTNSSDSSASTNPQTLTRVGDDVTVTGDVFGRVSSIATTTRKWDNRAKKYVNEITTSPGLKDISWTAAADGEYAGKLYISRQPNKDDFSTSTSYTDTVNKRLSNSREIELSLGTASITKDMGGKVTSTITKTVVESIGVTTCDQATNVFKLNSTRNLSLGMIIKGEGIGGIRISDINYTENIITISAERNIRDNTELTFYYSGVFSVDTINDHHTIISEEKINIHRNATVVFDNYISNVETQLTTTGSGGSTITISGTAFVDNFGNKDVTYTLNMDNFITNTPNAYNQNVEVTKNTARTGIDMVIYDTDSNASTKTITVVKSSRHGDVSGSGTTRTYTPYTGYTGPDKFTFTAGDGTNTSAEKTIYITVT